jgi:hypothetical protein
LDLAIWAIRDAGETTAAAMPDEPMAEEGPLLAREQRHEVLLDFDGVGVFGEAEALGQSRDVRIDNDAMIEFEGVAENDVGGFASDAAKAGEFFHRLRHFAAVTLDQGLAAGLDAFGFVAEEAGAFDGCFQVGGGRLGEIGGAAIFFEKLGGDEIDSFIGALSGKDGGDEQFERVGIIQLAVGLRIGFIEGGDYFGRARSFGCESFARHRGKGNEPAEEAKEVCGRRCQHLSWEIPVMGTAAGPCARKFQRTVSAIEKWVA